MVRLAKEYGMSALALTDHGVMFGTINFYETCLREGIKPILGCEVYVAPRKMSDRNPGKDKKQFHLLLLAENLEGYQNLLKICSVGWTDGFYYKPRVDKEFLSRHSKGIIAATACLGGEVPEMINRGDYDAAVKSFCEYREIFGKDNIYLELQDHDLPEQKAVNEAIIRMSQELDVKLICTNDNHYLTKADASAHDVLLCIQTSTTIDDPKRFRFGSQEFYFKSQAEMAERFGHIPGALENTLEIAERCNVELDFSRSQMPEPGIPEGMSADDYLEQLAWEGMNERYAEPTDEIRERVKMELDVIKTMGYPKYFLIVRDFALFSRQQGICIGVRGSAAGAIVGYCLGITDVDPIEYALPFERFLNIERVSMPDIDMDFQDDRRDEVIRYVTEKYGADHVSQIITFGTLGAKAAVRDVGRALGMPLADVDKICKMIPSIPVGISISKAMRENPEFDAAYKADPAVKKLIDTAKMLEGVSRHSSTHAAGIIISGDPLVESSPVMKGSRGEIISQFDAHGLEMVGLLKMDFLGLANLTILARCIKNVKQSRGEHIDILNIPHDDRSAFEMLSKGDTTGVFQLESAGMRKYIQELRPTSIKELAAMIALYRPGPMANIPQYIRCKNGQEKIEFLHPCLEPLLKDSYGVVVYQDDVMYIARAVAGFSLGQADILRRAMGKKKKEEMDKMKAKFFEGAQAKGISKKIAASIFDLVEPFAGYGFNKAHAVCYAHVAYQTAYLKANYPVEYFAAMLATHFDNKEKIALYIEECRRLKIEVLPPDVNASAVDFRVEDGKVRFGLAAIKNVGKGVVEAIVAARESGGPFLSLLDFCVRVMETGQVGKSVVDTLIRAGAFASIIPGRKMGLEMLDEAMSIATAINRDKLNGQAALFGGSHDDEDHSHAMDASKYENVPEFHNDELLAMEKDLLGLFVSDHPLMHVREQLERRVSVTSERLQELADEQDCVVGGLICEVKHHLTKRNQDKMAFVRIEDLTGTISVTIFPKVFKEFGQTLEADRIVIIRGKASHRERMGGKSSGDDEERSYTVEVLADSISVLKNGYKPAPLEETAQPQIASWGVPTTAFSAESVRPITAAGSSMAHTASEVHIRLSEELRNRLPGLRSAISSHPGQLPVYIHVPDRGDTAKVCTGCCVAPSPQFLAAIRDLVGAERVWTE